MQNALSLGDYRERKPHFVMLVAWRMIQVVWRWLPRGPRIFILRLFGAKIGKECTISNSAKIYAPWNLVCGDYVCVGPRADLYCKDRITLGSQVVVSQDAYLCTASHDISSPVMMLTARPIVVKDNVWIASRAIILPGVVIAEGAVVGCGAVVTRSVESWTVVGGNPACVLKRRSICGKAE